MEGQTILCDKTDCALWMIQVVLTEVVCWLSVAKVFRKKFLLIAARTGFDRYISTIGSMNVVRSWTRGLCDYDVRKIIMLTTHYSSHTIQQHLVMHEKGV